MPDMTIDLSNDEYMRLMKAASLQGMTVVEFAERAMSGEIARRYTLPSTGGKVVTFQLPKRSK